MNVAREQPRLRSSAAERIKREALRLFAERGVHGVTVREIASAAGQKNHAAIAYYFGSKEGLAREILEDRARLIDESRNRTLDEIEARGGPVNVREVVELIVQSSVDPRTVGEDGFIRFIEILNITHRDFFFEALSTEWNSGFGRCLEHLRSLMPPMPLAAKTQRLVFFGGAVRSILGMRESSLADASRPHPMWSAPSTLDHVVQVLTAMLEAPYEARHASPAADDPAGLSADPAAFSARPSARPTGRPRNRRQRRAPRRDPA